MPGPGYLTVLGPGEDYVLREIGQRMALAGQPGGRRLYAHAFHALDLKPGSASQEVAIALRPSAAVQGQVVGPDGRPVRDAVVISRRHPPADLDRLAVLDGDLPRRGAGRALRGARPGRRRRGPRLLPRCQAQPGCDRVPFGQVGGERTGHRPAPALRRGPGAAGRPRRQAGRPIARYLWVSHDHDGRHPGPHRSSQDKADQDRLAADQDFVARFDPIHYPKGLVSDAQGQLTLPALIPGATYRIYDGTTGDEAGPRLRKEFTVKPGETLDLGDILIEKPQA